MTAADQFVPESPAVLRPELAAALVGFQSQVPAIPKNRTAKIKTKGGGEYCLAPETRVLTADLEWVPVGKVQAGDRITAFDEHPTGVMKNRRKWRIAVVEAVGRESLPSCRITFADGTVITASEQHQWLTSHTDGTLHWRTTLDLARRGGHPVRVVRLTETWEADDSRDGGYIAGMYDGEGSLCQTPVQGRDAHQLILAMSQRENAALAHVEAILTGDGYQVGRGQGRGGSSGDVRQIVLAGGRPEVLRFLGTYRPDRLLAALDIDRLGTVHALRRVSVESVEPVGQVEVVTLATSTKTLIAEGLASHNSYKYADLADTWAAIRVPLHTNGLAVTQKLSGGRDGWMTLTTKVWHTSGQTDEDTVDVPINDRTPQEIGSQITYFKRYTLSAALGIATEDDDDGAAGSARHTGQERPGNGQSDEAREEAARAAVEAANVARGELLERTSTVGWTGDTLIERYAKDHNGEDLLAVVDLERIRTFGEALMAEAKPAQDTPTKPADPVDAARAQQTARTEQAADQPSEPLITKPQLTKLHTILSEDKINTHEARVAWCADMIGRPLTSTAEITKAEASTLFDKLDNPPR